MQLVKFPYVSLYLGGLRCSFKYYLLARMVFRASLAFIFFPPSLAHKPTSPEGTDTLFLGDSDEAVNHSLVTGDFTRDNLWVSVLGLDNQLDTLNGGFSKRRQYQ
jgi:hypothetical protein